MQNSFDLSEIKIRPPEYLNHSVFEQLVVLSDFYESLSDCVFSYINPGIVSVGNIDSLEYMSIKETLISIKEILERGRLNDSYALLRKYYDSVVINIYSNLYLLENHSFENFIVKKIDNWVKGKEKIPSYEKMRKYINDNSSVKEINELVIKDKRYIKLRERCNDNLHYNYFNNYLINTPERMFHNSEKRLDSFLQDIIDVFILHFAYIFYINDHYMSSLDYRDALDCNLTPEENSQYWVAPYVQTVFDNIIKKNRPDVAEAIKKNTCMDLV